MLYRLLKIILGYAVRKYFISIDVTNADRIPKDKPVLLLPNHRSAFMDPVVIASQIERTTYFLTRGESFGNPMAVRIFKRLKMIPIFRREHNPEKVDQNEDIFRHCHQLMAEKGCLMIFPEGVCQTKYVLMPIKTGAARIALESERKNNFELDVHLIPVGINYSNPHRFRGQLNVSIGEPIKVKEYEESFKADYWKAVEQVTEKIDAGLRKEILLLDDQTDIDTIQQIEDLTQAENMAKKKTSWYQIRLQIKQGLDKLRLQNEARFQALKQELSAYYGNLRRLRLFRSSNVVNYSGMSWTHGFWSTFIWLLVLLPLFLVAFALHISPFLTTRFLSLKVVKRVDFFGSLALILGLLVFTVYGLFQTWVVYSLTSNWIVTLVFAAVWPTLGLLAYGYYAELNRWIQRLNWRIIANRKKKLASELEATRSELHASVLSVISA